MGATLFTIKSWRDGEKVEGNVYLFIILCF